MLLGKYNQEKTVRFRLFQVDGVDFEPGATFAAGDIKIMKDEGVEANTTNLPTDEGQGYSLVLTATEMSAARIELYIVDQTATKVWLDTGLSIETYGNASAEHAFDLDTASTAQTADHTAAIADIPTVAEFNARTLVAADYFDPATDTVATVTTLSNLPAITAGWITSAGIAASALDGKGDWNVGKTGYTLSQSFPANFADFAITVTTGKVTAENVTLAAATHAGAVIPTVSTLSGHTAQTGDSFARIGVAGAGLTDLGGMSTGMKAEVQTEADASLVTYDGPTNTEFEARTPTVAQLAYIVANAATGMPVTFTTSGGSTTAAVLNNVDGAAASATNDQYNGRLLVFTDGTLKGVVTDITDYVGSTTTATITAIPFAPTATHNARLI